MTMKLKTMLLAALLFAVPFLAPPADAQTKLPVNAVTTADDVDVAILIRYIGAQASGTIEVASGDLLMKHGVLASEIADTTITGCGGTAGTLDVDNAACDTIGETLDRCNASANWRCVRLDSVRSDNDAGAKLLTRAATQANVVAGVSLFWDTSVAFHSTKALLPLGFRTIENYLGGPSGTTITPNPWAGRQTAIQYMNATSTYASGTSTLQFIEDPIAYATTGEVAPSTVVFSVAGGATTVNKVIADFEFLPFYCTPSVRCLVRINNSAAASVVTIVAAGVSATY